MLFNEDYSVESVKAIVAEFLTKGSYDREECTIRKEESIYASGSYAHKVMDDVWMFYNALGCASWDIKDDRGDEPVYYSLKPNRSTKSILWACMVQCDEYNACTMMVIAPTRRMAQLEATYQQLAGKWGPRKVMGVTPVSCVDCDTIPSWMK